MRGRRESPVHSGRLQFSQPVRRVRGGGKSPVWDVVITDHAIGESVTKEFASAARAAAWVASQVADAPAPAAPSMAPSGVRTGGAPTLGHVADSGSQLGARNVRINQNAGEKHAAAGVAHAPFNLRAVKEVLAEYGLDPTAEIARVLAEKRRITKDGQVLEVDAVAGVDRAKVLTELLQYVHPKLKAVEMKVEDKRTLTDEEINARIATILEGKAK